MSIQEYDVNGKQVYIFEDHNLAPIAWSKCPSNSPALLTFDHHTDTQLAFLQYHNSKSGGGIANVPFSELIEDANSKCSKIKTLDDVESAVLLLRNDEQIDFAIRSGILSYAYVISHDTNPQFEMKSQEYKAWFEEKNLPENFIRRITPIKKADLNYKMPWNRIISLSNDHFDEMGVWSEKERIDLSLDDRNLLIRMDEISRINASLFPRMNFDLKSNFILDIDLDYFNTRSSITPHNLTVFYELIRKSRIITIATENWYVENCRLEGEILDVEYLLTQLMHHIACATATTSINM